MYKFSYWYSVCCFNIKHQILHKIYFIFCKDYLEALKKEEISQYTIHYILYIEAKWIPPRLFFWYNRKININAMMLKIKTFMINLLRRILQNFNS